MKAAATATTIVPILLYHGVSDDCSAEIARFTVAPSTFDAQLRQLAEAGYETLTVSAFRPALLGATERLPARPLLITFDDGFANFATDALPMLQRYGFAATLYATTGFIGAGPAAGRNRYGDPMLTWSELAAVSAAGVEVGAHTHDHPMLDTLPHAKARQEITRSKELIEQHLQAPVGSFAYPHGYSSAWVRHEVQKAGFTTACAVKNALSHTGDDLFAIARLTIEAGHSPEAVAAMVAGHGVPVAPARESVKTWGWRQARRTMAAGRRASGRTGRPAGAGS
ncbi:MAG TPA: polysaccharide deacetylase family protein [Actinomycetota bacterium]|nr:polysaccharide deacetylase family protein [Actinomycetota bacterium]